MTRIAVKDSPKLKSTYFTWKRAIAGLGVIAVSLLLWFFVIAPWLVRHNVEAALEAAGFGQATFRVSHAGLMHSELRDVTLDDVRVDRVTFTYAPGGLSRGQLNDIVISGARIPIDRGLPTMERKGGAATRTSKLSFPFKRITLSDVQITSGEDRKLDVNGSIAGTLDAGSFKANAQAIDSSFIKQLAEALQVTLPVDLTGKLNGEAKGDWTTDGGSVEAKLTVSDGQNNASDAKLSVAKGVFQGVAQWNATTRPSAIVKVRDVDFATPALTAETATGEVKFASLFPLESEPKQHMTAARLRVGQMEFTDGLMEFQVSSTGDNFIGRTRWSWLGGIVAASDVRLPANGPVQFTLHARDVDLGQLLQTFAQEKAAGTGKISGDIPVTMNGSKIEFGKAQLTALSGGVVQIKDAAAIAPTAEAAAQAANSPSASEQIKRNIVEALGDFQYDTLTAILTNEADGLVANIEMTGRGRTGAKQGIDYHLRVNKLDQLMRLYLNMRTALSAPPTTRKASQ